MKKSLLLLAFLMISSSAWGADLRSECVHNRQLEYIHCIGKTESFKKIFRWVEEQVKAVPGTAEKMILLETVKRDIKLDDEAKSEKNRCWAQARKKFQC